MSLTNVYEVTTHEAAGILTHRSARLEQVADMARLPGGSDADAIG